MNTARLLGLGAAFALAASGAALAQSTGGTTRTAPDTTPPARVAPAPAPADSPATTTTPRTTTEADRPAAGTGTAATGTGSGSPPFAGANSFTEAQAKSRIEEAGFTNVMNLRKDDQGIWRGTAKRGDTQVNVGLDYRGNLVTQ